MVRDDDNLYEPDLGVQLYGPARLVAVDCGKCGLSRASVVSGDALRRAVLRARGHAVHRPWTGFKMFGWLYLAVLLTALASGEVPDRPRTFYVIAGEWIPRQQVDAWVGGALSLVALAAAIRTWEGRNFEPCPSCGKPRARFAVLAPAGGIDKDSLYARYAGLARSVSWWIVLTLFFAWVQR